MLSLACGRTIGGCCLFGGQAGAQLALGLRQAPTLVVWGSEPTLYVGAAQIREFLKTYAQ